MTSVSNSCPPSEGVGKLGSQTGQVIILKVAILGLSPFTE